MGSCAAEHFTDMANVFDHEVAKHICKVGSVDNNVSIVDYL